MPILVDNNDRKQPDKQEEDPEESDDEEEIEEAFVEPPPNIPLKTTMRTSTPKPSVVHSGPHKYKEDEKKWDPISQSSKFISNGYRREELILEPPASFDGAEGTYQVIFENNNTTVVVKIAPNLALSDPHDINAYYSQKYGIVTAKDSARDQAFKESAKSITDKWYTYRHHLDWPGKPSDDLGVMPWLDFADISSHGRVFPLLIINLSSVSPVEEKPKKVTGGLTRNKFHSPAKLKGVDMAGDKTAQMAAMLESMIMSGTMTPGMRSAVRKFASDEDDMQTGDDHTNNKRPNTGPTEQHSSDNSLSF